MFRLFVLVLCFEACRSQSSCPDTCGGVYWNRGQCSNGKMQTCACRPPSDAASLSVMGGRAQGQCKPVPHDAMERSAINELRDETIRLMKRDIQSASLRYSDFCRYMQIPLDLVGRAYLTNIGLFKDDLTTAVPPAATGSVFDIFLSVFLVVLNAVPIVGAQAEAIAKLSSTPQIVKALEKFAESAEDVDAYVLSVDSVALGYSLSEMNKDQINSKDQAAFTVDVIDFVGDLYRGRQLTELKFIAAMHEKISKLYSTFNVPETLTKSSNNLMQHQTLLQFHLEKAFDSVQTQGEAYRTLLSNYFNSAGIGFMVKRNIQGTYEWTISGLPDDIKNRFMGRLLEYTGDCLKPSQHMVDGNGLPVGSALLVEERPNRVIRTRMVKAGRTQDVMIRQRDKKVSDNSGWCSFNKFPSFKGVDAAQRSLQKFNSDPKIVSANNKFRDEQKGAVQVSHARAVASVPWIMHAAGLIVVWFQQIL